MTTARAKQLRQQAIALMAAALKDNQPTARLQAGAIKVKIAGKSSKISTPPAQGSSRSVQFR